MERLSLFPSFTLSNLLLLSLGIAFHNKLPASLFSSQALLFGGAQPKTDSYVKYGIVELVLDKDPGSLGFTLSFAANLTRDGHFYHHFQIHMY